MKTLAIDISRTKITGILFENKNIIKMESYDYNDVSVTDFIEMMVFNLNKDEYFKIVSCDVGYGITLNEVEDYLKSILNFEIEYLEPEYYKNYFTKNDLEMLIDRLTVYFMKIVDSKNVVNFKILKKQIKNLEVLSDGFNQIFIEHKNKNIENGYLHCLALVDF